MGLVARAGSESNFWLRSSLAQPGLPAALAFRSSLPAPQRFCPSVKLSLERSEPTEERGLRWVQVGRQALRGQVPKDLRFKRDLSLAAWSLRARRGCGEA